MNNSAREILIAFAVKYKGDWDAIFSAIKNKEEFDEEEIKIYNRSIKSKIVTILDLDYPEYLKRYYKPPLVLFYYGDLSLIKNEDFNLGVIGTRDNSSYGEYMTRKLVKGVSEKLVIISGLARGIDGIAAEECLKNKGKTVAVLGSGIDFPYPKRNEALYNKIKRDGLVISEYPNDLIPNQNYFKVRNRIIAYLSKHLLIIEAKEKSGTSITATFAIEKGCDIFCVPQRATSDSFCNKLIQTGAKLVIDPCDILEEFSNFSSQPIFEN